MANIIVPRSIFHEVASHLKEKEITIIIGARQVGKTTLLMQLKEYLLERKIAAEAIKIFNLDLISDLELFDSQKNFINYLKSELVGHKRVYVFVDEVQRLKNPGLFFKGVYDLNLPAKFVLTGSSSLEIKAKTQEPLTGRKRLFYLFPFSFEEFIIGTANPLSKILNHKRLTPYHLIQIMDKLREYLVYGGYPRVALEKKTGNKLNLLKEIFSSYIEKDIIGFLKIREALNYSRLVALLAAQVGQLVNAVELGNTLDMKQETIQAYLGALEETFICHLVRPYFTNFRKELVKMPKLFFWDNGIRNAPLEALRDYEGREDRGALLENFVFAEIARKNINRVRFWRTKDKNEIDFVLTQPAN